MRTVIGTSDDRADVPRSLDRREAGATRLHDHPNPRLVPKRPERCPLPPVESTTSSNRVDDVHRRRR